MQVGGVEDNGGMLPVIVKSTVTSLLEIPGRWTLFCVPETPPSLFWVHKYYYQYHTRENHEFRFAFLAVKSLNCSYLHEQSNYFRVLTGVIPVRVQSGRTIPCRPRPVRDLSLRGLTMKSPEFNVYPLYLCL